MFRASLRQIGIVSTFKFGCVLGALFNLAPSVLCAVVTKWSIGSLRALLESWQNFELTTILGQSVRANLVERLGLLDALKTLRALDGVSWLIVALIVFALCMFGGVIVGACISGGAAIYNLIARVTGGIQIELANDATPRGRG